MRHFLATERFNRMLHDNSQLGRVPSESSLGSHHTEANIDQLLIIDVVTTDSSSLEVVTTTPIVVSATQQVPIDALQHNPTTRQLARRR